MPKSEDILGVSQDVKDAVEDVLTAIFKVSLDTGKPPTIDEMMAPFLSRGLDKATDTDLLYVAYRAMERGDEEKNVAGMLIGIATLAYLAEMTPETAMDDDLEQFFGEKYNVETKPAAFDIEGPSADFLWLDGEDDAS